MLSPILCARRAHVSTSNAVAHFALLLFVATTWAGITKAAPFTPGDVIAASQQTLIEYTPAGVAVQTISVPNGGTGGGLRDLMVDKYGNVQIYNGTFTPVLTQYNPATGGFTHQASAFSTVNNLTYGGLAAAGNYVYVTDMNTNGSPGAGLVRYTIGGGPTSVIGGAEYIDVTLGRNGKLYAVRADGVNGGGQGIDIFDPLTGAPLGNVTLADEVRGIAVDANGDFYGVSLFTPITHYSSTGQRVKTLTDTVGGLGDIDIDSHNNLTIASHSGALLFTTTDLIAFTGFNKRNTTDLNFVAWVEPAMPLPEPSSCLTIFGVACVAVMRRKRSAGAR